MKKTIKTLALLTAGLVVGVVVGRVKISHINVYEDSDGNIY